MEANTASAYRGLRRLLREGGKRSTPFFLIWFCVPLACPAHKEQRTEWKGSSQHVLNHFHGRLGVRHFDD